MADIKISALPTATTPLTGAELVPVVQGGVTKQTTTSDVLAVPVTSLTASSAVATDASKKLVSVTNTGTGNNVLATSPTLVTPILGTPQSVTLTNATGLPISTGVSGLGTGVATALAVNVGTAGSPVVNGGALGTPSSGTVTNLTGTASININGTVGATTPAAVSATALSYTTTLTGGTGIVNLGSGQFYKDASGNVGIGTAAPSFQLVTSKADTSSTVGNSAASVHIVNTDSGAFGRLSELVFNVVNQTNTSALASVSGQYATFGGSYGGNLLFSTNAGSGGSVTEKLRITSTGDVTVSTAALLGYGTGSGGTVTQATSKSTAVTLNKPTGQITMNNAALAAGAIISFTINNSLVSAADMVLITYNFSAGVQNYNTWIGATLNGSFVVNVKNISAVSLSDAVVINFAVIKGATS